MQYRIGTVSVNYLSQDVLGFGTEWIDNIKTGDLFKIVGEDAWYEVGSVIGNTHLTLTSQYMGSTRIGTRYVITRDFTPNFNLPEVYIGDLDAHWIITRAFRKIDEVLGYGTFQALGNREIIRVYNPTASTIEVGSVVLLDKESPPYVKKISAMTLERGPLAMIVDADLPPKSEGDAMTRGMYTIVKEGFSSTDELYLSDTPGELTNSPATSTVKLGHVRSVVGSTVDIFFHPQNEQTDGHFNYIIADKDSLFKGKLRIADDRELIFGEATDSRAWIKWSSEYGILAMDTDPAENDQGHFDINLHGDGRVRFFREANMGENRAVEIYGWDTTLYDGINQTGPMYAHFLVGAGGDFAIYAPRKEIGGTIQTRDIGLWLREDAGDTKVKIMGAGVEKFLFNSNGDMWCAGNINLKGTVDGVDVNTHNHDGTATMGPQIDHGNLLGLADNDHPEYVRGASVPGLALVAAGYCGGTTIMRSSYNGLVVKDKAVAGSYTMTWDGYVPVKVNKYIIKVNTIRYDEYLEKLPPIFCVAFIDNLRSRSTGINIETRYYDPSTATWKNADCPFYMEVLEIP